MPISDVLEKLRRQQKTRGQKAKEQRSCTPCSEAISGIMIHFKDMANDLEIVRDMHRSKVYIKRIDNGPIYTIEDIEARINRTRCLIEDSLKRYQECCKEGKLPVKEKFKC